MNFIFKDCVRCEDCYEDKGVYSSRAFKALSRSLPCLQQLEILHLGGDKRYDDRVKLTVDIVALRSGDVRAIGRALKAWPLPLFYNIG